MITDSAVFYDAESVEAFRPSDLFSAFGVDRGPCPCSLTACGGSWAALPLLNLSCKGLSVIAAPAASAGLS